MYPLLTALFWSIQFRKLSLGYPSYQKSLHWNIIQIYFNKSFVECLNTSSVMPISFGNSELGVMRKTDMANTFIFRIVDPYQQLVICVSSVGSKSQQKRDLEIPMNCRKDHPLLPSWKQCTHPVNSEFSDFSTG